ncbi:geranylgeranyl pyrophosphate synthetase [Podospora appendiculata]|uniref:Geranylgeranyl pyrophosphate synthetase n=1 Tax=Podospora appendiculata TaxID=314037 RepID=A0AAE1CGB3_9PEZI|nr:geranylgeranyl pyrophosphate synthetase [Podospora appendiculata]
MMPYCHCERYFGSEAALIQHQVAKHGSQVLVATELPTSSQPNHAPAPQQKKPNPRFPTRDARLSHEVKLLLKGVLSEETLHTIDAAALQPSNTLVSSTAQPELICSYNWQGSGGFRAPGHAPIWKTLTLPITISNDRTTQTRSGKKPIWTKPEDRFYQVFQATAQMRPDFRFNDVDVITTRNSLRKFLDFCRGRAQDPFKVHVSLVKNTLFIEQYHVRPMARQNTGWGHGFERAFAEFPPGLQDSTSHDRFLRYPIGDLNCIVGFEIDACYQEGAARRRDEGPLEGLKEGLEQLSLGNIDPEVAVPRYNQEIMPQSTAAELKTSKPGKTSIGAYLPQLWFGRTPWLIVGSHNEGTFLDTKVTNVEQRLKQWETERQDELRKLVTLLAELREALRGRGGQRFAVVYEKGETSRVLKMYKLVDQGKPAALDESILGGFWA